MQGAAPLVLLIVAAPFAISAAWSDLKFMIISNRLNIALAVAFVIAGPLVLPLGDYGLRLAVGVTALVVGFVLNMLGLVGGGDAKFAAAMLPFVAPGDLGVFAVLFLVMLLAAFAAHRLCRALPAFRNAVPDWKSWRSGEAFPMGLALAGALLFYLAASALSRTPIAV